MATNNSNGTCPAKQPACPKTSPQRLAQKATTITPTCRLTHRTAAFSSPCITRTQAACWGKEGNLSSASHHTRSLRTAFLHRYKDKSLTSSEQRLAATPQNPPCQSSSCRCTTESSTRNTSLCCSLWRSKLPLWCLLGRPPLHHLSATAGELFFSISMHLGTFSQSSKKAKEGKAKSPEKPRNKEEHPEGGRKEFQEWEREKYQSPHRNKTKVLQHRSSNKARLTKERQTTRKTEQSKTKTRNTRVQHMNSRQHHRKAKHRKTGPLPRHRHTLI